jgi:hypothetical protein
VSAGAALTTWPPLVCVGAESSRTRPDVRWTGSFTEGLRGTGPLMLIFLHGVVRFLAARLVKAAEND